MLNIDKCACLFFHISDQNRSSNTSWRFPVAEEVDQRRGRHQIQRQGTV